MTSCIYLGSTFNLVSAADPPPLDSYESDFAEACLPQSGMNSLSGMAHAQWYSTCLAWQALDSIPSTAKINKQTIFTLLEVTLSLE